MRMRVGDLQQLTCARDEPLVCCDSNDASVLMDDVMGPLLYKTSPAAARAQSSAFGYC